MSLIERLGGYEAAKLEGEKWGFDEFLLRKLLEYRREHKFYEVGDLVTYKAHSKGVWREGFGKITDIVSDLECVIIDNIIGVTISEIEHVNDEEIKSGRRL